MDGSWKIALALLIVSMICLGAGSDHPLGIFGNANMDGTIDEKDVAYVEGIIKGANAATNLSDANYDSKIDAQDIELIEQIIHGEEKELTLLDAYDTVVTIRKPLERIIVEGDNNAELMRILRSENKIVAVFGEPSEIQFPEFSNLPNLGDALVNPDYEAILSANPDLLLTFGAKTTDSEKKKKLPGVAVVFLGLLFPDLYPNPENSQYLDGVRKLGYILDKEDEAEEYIQWYLGWINKIKSRTETIPVDERPRVLVCNNPKNETSKFRAYAKMDTLAQMCLLAGGKNIAENIPEFVGTKDALEVETEWVITQNPEFIFVHNAAYAPVHGYGADDPTAIGDPAGMKVIRDGLMNRSELSNVTAVETGDVYIMSGLFRNDGSGGLVGTAYMAKLLHPDLFEDLDPEAIQQEYLKLQDFDFDLDEHGIIIYPPIEIDGGLAGIPDKYKGQAY